MSGVTRRRARARVGHPVLWSCGVRNWHEQGEFVATGAARYGVFVVTLLCDRFVGGLWQRRDEAVFVVVHVVDEVWRRAFDFFQKGEITALGLWR